MIGAQDIADVWVPVVGWDWPVFGMVVGLVLLGLWVVWSCRAVTAARWEPCDSCGREAWQCDTWRVWCGDCGSCVEHCGCDSD